MPYYSFDKQKFLAGLRAYSSCFDVFYPCKVNSCDLIIEAVNNSESCFEVDSIELIKHLVINKGINPNKILYNFLIRSESDIKTALDLGVSMFAIDDLNAVLEMEQFDISVEYIVRVSIKEFLHIDELSGFIDKWGNSVREIKKIISYINQYSKGKVKGISFYYPQEYNTYERIIKTIDTIIKEFNCAERKYCIDIGGGISESEAVQIYHRYQNQGIKFIIEPGRHLIGDCLNLICSIIDVRIRGGKKYVFLDVGVYSGLADCIIKNHKFEVDFGVDSFETEEVMLCGCTSDISDVLGIYRAPKQAIKKGTQLTIKNCGAYCIEFYMNFSGHKPLKIMELLDGREPPSLPNKGSVLL